MGDLLLKCQTSESYQEKIFLVERHSKTLRYLQRPFDSDNARWSNLLWKDFSGRQNTLSCLSRALLFCPPLSIQAHNQFLELKELVQGVNLS